MVRAAILAGALLALVACDLNHAREPIAPPSPAAANRRNIAAHVVDPVPRPGARQSTSAEKTGLAVTAYRTGEVKNPTEQSTAPKTTDTQTNAAQ